MPKIESVSWGKVKIDGREYHQVLIVGDKVFERDKPKLEELFGTTHQIGDWEEELLLSQNPEIILIATGWSGVLKVTENLKFKIENLGIELKTVLTPKIVSEYNRLVAEGKKVNALIHTTC
ncbi:MAG: MTH938/NDUFAF3 family protein [Microgenomates group bacterium]